MATALAAEPGAEKLPFVYTKWKQFTVKDGLPDGHIFAVKSDGDRLWVGTENGLARLSGERFDHWHQLNSGLSNDVVYGVAVGNDNVWAATTAGASRYNTVTGEWTIFTEKNAPMEEIWNYGVHYRDGNVHLAVWGSGVLEYEVKTNRWKDCLDPDGEMEIDLNRDDGIVHVITTGANYVDGVTWVSPYFGLCRYDGRNWRGFFNMDSGLPSDFNNNLRARSGREAWFASDKGLGAVMDAETNTWVAYTRDPKSDTGKAVVRRDRTVLETVEMGLNLPTTSSSPST